MILSNKVYDTIKWLVTVVSPAFGTLYLGVSALLTQYGLASLPYPEVVVGIISLVTAFLGSILHISSSNYSQGELTVDESKDDSDESKYQLVLHADLPTLAENKSFVVSVNKTQN